MQVQLETKLHWEKLHSAEPKHEFTYASVYRSKVPGGWLIAVFHSSGHQGASMSTTFLPDAKHEWDGGSLT